MPGLISDNALVITPANPLQLPYGIVTLAGESAPRGGPFGSVDGPDWGGTAKENIVSYAGNPEARAQHMGFDNKSRVFNGEMSDVDLGFNGAVETRQKIIDFGKLGFHLRVEIADESFIGKIKAWNFNLWPDHKTYKYEIEFHVLDSSAFDEKTVFAAPPKPSLYEAILAAVIAQAALMLIEMGQIPGSTGIPGVDSVLDAVSIARDTLVELSKVIERVGRITEGAQRSIRNLISVADKFQDQAYDLRQKIENLNWDAESIFMTFSGYKEFMDSMGKIEDTLIESLKDVQDVIDAGNAQLAQSGWSSTTMRDGDTVESIAVATGASADEIRDANSIGAGQPAVGAVLLIPVSRV